MRKLSLALIAIGAFLIVMGPMVRYYAYPRLAVAPANQVSDTGLEAENATIFDIGSLSEITTDLTISVRTIGDASTPDKYPGSVTYVNSTSTVSADGVMRSRDVERMTFDETSGEATKGVDDDFISAEEGVDTPVTHTGLLAKFPFNTQKKTYDFWDSTMRDSNPIKYTGTTKIEGMTVYEFQQTIAPTQVGEMEVPISLLGLPGEENVTGQEMYSVDRALWVEPETGVIIKREEAQLSTLDYDGEPRLTLSDATVGYDAKTIRTNIDEYGSQGTLLHLTRVTGPLLALIVGFGSLIMGIAVSRRRPVQAPAEERQLHRAGA